MSEVAGIRLSPPAEKPEARRAELRQAAEAFEALLIQSMLRQMREAQLEEGFFGKGTGSSVYEAMFEQFLSEGMAGASPLGIAEVLEQEWTGGKATREQAIRALRQAGEAGTAPMLDLLLGSPEEVISAYKATTK